MRRTGLGLILFLVLLPMIAFVSLASRHDPIAIASQYLGSVALILMGISQLIATRWRGLETIFGALDRMYVLHKWLGVAAMGAILLHDTIDADIEVAGGDSLLVEIAETLGEFSLYGLLILVVLSLATFIPYHLWKFTHKAMGVLFAASALHFLWIARPFSIADPLGLYISAFCLLGVVSYAYTLVPFPMLQGGHFGKVSQVSESGNCLDVQITMQAKPFCVKAGQFVLISYANPQLKEPHPFTVSGVIDDHKIRLTVKPTGDYTEQLKTCLQPGEKAYVSRPFGHFQRKQTAAVEILDRRGRGHYAIFGVFPRIAAKERRHLSVSLRTKPRQRTPLPDDGKVG